MKVLANQAYETPQTTKEPTRVVNEEGQARSRALDHQHPATPEARAADEYDKKLKQEDCRNEGAARAFPGKHPKIQKPRSKKGMARAAPQMANATTACAWTIPRWMGQTEAQSRTHI